MKDSVKNLRQRDDVCFKENVEVAVDCFEYVLSQAYEIASSESKPIQKCLRNK
jgi:hypothetical protein